MNHPITEPRSLPSAQDSTVLRRTIIKLTATQKILSASVIVVLALVWWDLLNRLIAFGRGIDYSGLGALGLDTIALIQHYNPFFGGQSSLFVPSLLPIFSIVLHYTPTGYGKLAWSVKLSSLNWLPNSRLRPVKSLTGHGKTDGILLPLATYNAPLPSYAPTAFQKSV